MITTLYQIPIIISHTNGGGEDYLISTTPDKDIIENLLDYPLYNFDDPGTFSPDGEFNDDDFGIRTFIDTNHPITEISTDPDQILRIFYKTDSIILGFENFHKFPELPPTPSDLPSDGSIPF